MFLHVDPLCDLLIETLIVCLGGICWSLLLLNGKVVLKLIRELHHHVHFVHVSVHNEDEDVDEFVVGSVQSETCSQDTTLVQVTLVRDILNGPSVLLLWELLFFLLQDFGENLNSRDLFCVFFIHEQVESGSVVLESTNQIQILIFVKTL